MSDTTTTPEATAGAPAPEARQTDTLEEQRRANEDATAETAEQADDAKESPFADVVLEADGLPSEEDLRKGLRAVIDPEIGYNIVDLGLVYGVEKDAESKHVHVVMTLTSMGCPLTEIIQQQVTVIMLAFPGVESADVEFTFSPPWSPAMIEEYVAEELRAMGMNV